jgi:hypothetical protein
MNPKRVITLFQLPMFPAASGVCALDQDGELYFNPGFISDRSLRKAHRQNVLHYIPFKNGFVGLVSLAWARKNRLESDYRLDLLESVFRKFIASRDDSQNPNRFSQN